MHPPPAPGRDFDLLVIGDVNVDIILSGMAALPRSGTEELAADLDFRSGGSSANCARAAARLGARVAFIGLVGHDRFGDFLLDALRAAGVHTDYTHRSPQVRTGVTVSLSMAHDRAFATYLGSVAALSPHHVEREAFARARHLHLGGYFLTQGLRGSHRALLAQARQAGMTTSLDVGWDPEQRWNGDLRAALPLVEVLLPNETEALALSGAADLEAAAERLAETTPTVAVKLGAEGSLGRRGRTRAHAPAFPVQVLDTTALGDCFNAAFLLGHLEGMPLERCLQMGNAAAALAAARLGDDRYPTRAEVEGLLDAPP